MDATQEQWRPVVGYEGYYEVSDHGQVRSIDRIAVRSNGRPHTVRGRIMAGARAPRTGHRMVTLCIDHRQHTIAIHRAVARAFIGETPPAQVVRHLNDDVEDNRLVNLAFGTVSDNAHDSVRNGGHHHASKSHCVNGHEFSMDNTYRAPGSNHRQCRRCKSKRDRERRDRRNGMDSRRKSA